MEAERSLGRFVVRDWIAKFVGRPFVCTIGVEAMSMLDTSVASATSGSVVVKSDAALSAAGKIVDETLSTRTVVGTSIAGAFDNRAVGDGRSVVRSLCDGIIVVTSLTCEIAVVTSAAGVSLVTPSRTGNSLTWGSAEERDPARSVVGVSTGKSDTPGSADVRLPSESLARLSIDTPDA